MANACQDCGQPAWRTAIRCKTCQSASMRKNPVAGRNYCACGGLKAINAEVCKDCHLKHKHEQKQEFGPHCRGCGKKIVFEGRCYECATHRPRLLVPA